MNDQQIEQEIQAKGLTAPRITPADVESEITHCYYVNAGEAQRAKWPDPSAADDLHPGLDHVTMCVLILKNGHKIVGVNTGSVSAANFDAELACKLARQHAVDQVWPLLGFRLRDELLRA